MVSIIAAIGYNRALGKNNKLLWRIPDDLKRFKTLTTGHPIIMGRKTFESIDKPLPNRTNIVITRAERSEGEAEGVVRRAVILAHSIEDAIEKAKALDSEVFVIGGAQIYEQALPFADKLYLTLINDKKGADVYFPAYETVFTKMTFHEDREFNGLTYKWVDLERE